MCWLGINNKRIADEDINVFKIVRKPVIGENKHCFISLYFSYEYAVGETYEAKISVLPNIHWSIVINSGLHSYSTDCRIDNTYKFTDKGRIIAVMGKKSTEVINDLLEPGIDYIKLNCIIPKGTTFFENHWGEIVSEKLKIVSAENIN